VYDTSIGQVSAPLVANGRVHVVGSFPTGDPPTGLHAVDAASGTRAWVNEGIPTGEGEPPSSPVMAGDVIFVGDVVGTLYAVDPGTGSIRWTHDTGWSAVVHPAVTDGRVYVTGLPNYAAFETAFGVLEEPDSEPDERVLTITGDGESANYEFTVSDSLEANPSEGELERDNDAIAGTLANGWVTDPEHVDSYRFTGDVVDFHFEEGRASVTLDGASADPDTLGKSLPNVLVVRGEGEPTNYEFTVSEWLASDATGPDLELGNDRIDGRTANGWVTEPSHEDGYRFRGSLTDAQFLRGTATVLLNGRDVTDRFTDDDTGGGSVLTVRGQGAPTNYEFTVSGSLDPSDGTLEPDNDTIAGSIANGWVTDPEHVDSYQFTGDVVDVHFERGEARVTVDGTRVDPDDVGKSLPRTLRVAGTGDPANYEFTVSEWLASDATGPDLELGNDRIDGRTANGWVTEPSHEDGFRFAGRVTEFRLLEGEVRVWRDGERVDPDELGD
jgi:hypothetical protein